MQYSLKVGVAYCVLAGCFGSAVTHADDEAMGRGKAPPAGPFTKLARLNDSDLKSIAGKADVSQSVIAQNTSTVSGNSVNGPSTTGNLSFSAESFSQLHGLALVSANTGNNVSMNSSMNVTVALQH